jgi:hypothetical protein
MNTSRVWLGGAGTQTSTLAFGGVQNTNFPFTTPQVTGATESWNGTSWTTVNSLNTARTQLSGAGLTSSSVIAFGGNSAYPNNLQSATELYDGSTWTSVPPMTTARMTIGGGIGTQASALTAGGFTPSLTAATEEWTGAQTTATASTLTTS